MDTGFLLVDKPSGVSSAKVIAKIKKNLNLDKIGHAGTLDPLATGLLIVLVGRATKLARFAESGRKIYSGEILLGTKTNTDDIDGQVIEQSDNIPDLDLVLKTCYGFVGKQIQTPPNVSAVKVNGQRAYDLARQGKDLELKGRSIEVFSFEAKLENKNIIRFRIDCSKGTYIRSIARDIGEKLNCGACIKSLRREYSYPFSVENAKTPDLISVSDMLEWDSLFPNITRVSLDDFQAKQCLQGNVHAVRKAFNECAEERVIYQADSITKPLGLMEKKDQVWSVAFNFTELGEELCQH
jgi:tRNA pseudouridine55 synthase